MLPAFRTIPSLIVTQHASHLQLNDAWNPLKLVPSVTSVAPEATAALLPPWDGIEYPSTYVPMIEPTTYAVLPDDLYDHPHRIHHAHPLAPDLDSSAAAVTRRQPETRTPVALDPTPTRVVRTHLRSQVQTKILAIVYNADSTKFKTITHTRYYSTRITMMRTAGVEVPFTALVSS